MTSLTFAPIPVPLHEDEQGAIRIGNTRVLLDLVIHEFDSGASPEEIVQCYDVLDLAHVYAVISYYLHHPEAIKAYLQRRDSEAQAVQKKIEGSQPPRPNLRALLIARAKAKELTNAPAD